jgi:hypothetical protein
LSENPTSNPNKKKTQIKARKGTALEDHAENRTDTGHGIKGVYEDDALNQRFFHDTFMDKLLFCVQVFGNRWDRRGSAGSSGVYLAVASIGAPGSPSVIVYSMYTRERTDISRWMQGWTIFLGVEIYSFSRLCFGKPNGR